MAEMAVTIVSQPSGDLGPQHDYAYVEYEFSERWAVRIDVQTDEKVGTDLWEHCMTWDYPVPGVSFYLQRPTTSVRYKFTGVSTGEVIISQIASWTWVNAVPVISGTVADLGEKDAPFSYTYSVSDPDGDKLTVTEKLNKTTIRTLTKVTSGSELTLTISADEFGALADQAQHTITITIDDGLNGTDTQAMVFTKNASVDATAQAGCAEATAGDVLPPVATASVMAPYVEPRAYFMSPGFIAYMRPTWTMQGYGEALAPTARAEVTVIAAVAEAEAELLTPTIRAGATVTAPAAETTGEMLSAFVDLITLVQATPADLSAEMLAPTARASVVARADVTSGITELLIPRISSSVSIAASILEALGELIVPDVRVSAGVSPSPADCTGELVPPIVRAGVMAHATPAEMMAEALDPYVDTLYIVQAGVADAIGELLPLVRIIAGTGCTIQVTCAKGYGEMLDCIVQIRYAGPRLTALTRPQDVQIIELPGRLDLINRKSRLEVFSK